MKNLALLLAAVGFCSISVSAGAAQGAAPRLVFDQAHGEQTPPEPLNGIADKLGLEIETSARPITADALEGVRILYLRAPSEEFTVVEREAIVAFVKGGGSLLLVLDEEQRQ